MQWRQAEADWIISLVAGVHVETLSLQFTRNASLVEALFIFDGQIMTRLISNKLSHG